MCNKTIVTFSFVVRFNRGQSLVIALSLPIARRLRKMSDYPLAARRMVTSMAGIVFKLASLDHVVEYAVGFRD